MRNSTLIKKSIDSGIVYGTVDIENCPAIVAGWGLFDQNFGMDQILTTPKITSISYMKETDSKPTTLGWTFNEDAKGSDTSLLLKFSEWVKDVDVIIGQNTDAFDIKMINWRINELGLPPIEWPQFSLDILKLSRKVFRPLSHKLDFRSRTYGFGGKIDQTMKQIMKVMDGDEKEQAERMRYNAKDVLDTRKVFWREVDSYKLPVAFVKHLERIIKGDKPFCKHCQFNKKNKFDITQFRVKLKDTKNYKFRYQCNRCDYIWDSKK